MEIEAPWRSTGQCPNARATAHSGGSLVGSASRREGLPLVLMQVKVLFGLERAPTESNPDFKAQCISAIVYSFPQSY